MKKLILISIVAILSLTGCTNSTSSENKLPENEMNGSVKTVEQNNPAISPAPVELALKTKIENKDPKINVKNLSIASSEIIPKGMLVKFLFEDNNNSYEGTCQIEGSLTLGTILGMDYTPVDKAASFTVNQFTNKDDASGFTYLMTSGVILDSSIKEMLLFYNDGSLANVIVGKTNTYSYVKKDKESTIKEIKALDKDKKTIFNFPPYPPKKIK